MPVTVKFSREFYDRFGHEAVDELVNYLNQIDSGYRSELSELNERNFARFDDKLERRVAQLDAKIDRRSGELGAKLEQRVAELKLEMSGRFDQLRNEIAATRADVIKWMFVFVATAVLAILGLG